MKWPRKPYVRKNVKADRVLAAMTVGTVYMTRDIDDIMGERWPGRSIKHLEALTARGDVERIPGRHPYEWKRIR